MKPYEKIDFQFYRLKRHMGDIVLEEFLKTPFYELYCYDGIYGKWIVDELLQDGEKLLLLFKRSRLRKKELMAQLFLRMFYFDELQKRK